MVAEHIDTTDAYKFVEILKSGSELYHTKGNFEDWANDVLDLCLEHRKVKASGGVIIPQVGDHLEIKRQLSTFLDLSKKQKNYVENIINRYWENPNNEPVSNTLPEENGQIFCCNLVPVILGFDRPIGVAWVVSENVFSQITRFIVEYAAGIVSLVIRAEKGTHALRQLSEPVLVNTEKISKVYMYVTQLCISVLTCKACILWRVNKTKNVLNTVASSGEGCTSMRVDMSIGNGIAGKCAQDGKRKIIDDLYAVDATANPALIREKKLRSAIFVPLDTGGEIEGVLAAYANRPHAFSKFDCDILS